MNVLIYNDEGSSAESVRQSCCCLRALLSDKYAVTTITAQQLIAEPWANYTSMLVIPGGADLPYCRALNGEGNDRIRDFVRKGGSFLGICAGGYYAAQFIEFEKDTELEVSGARELNFYAGTAKGTVFKGFEYFTQHGARGARLTYNKDGKEAQTKCFYNGGCLFEGDSKAEVIARYEPPVEIECSELSPAAIVYKQIGKGHVVLSGAHFEYDMDDKIVKTGELDTQVIDDLKKTESTRDDLVRLTLSKLNLELSKESKHERVPAHTPIYLSSLETGKPNVDQFLENISDLVKNGVLVDAGDTFKFTDVLDVSYKESNETLVEVFRTGYPKLTDTPRFNHSIYYAELKDAIANSRLKSSVLGNMLMYGEVIASTSSIFEKNLKFLNRVPHGTIALGTQQTAGRGRGSNVWVNPLGVMAVSGVLRIPHSQCKHPLVFVQYLVSLAFVNAVHSFLPENTDIGLRLKWPNDIYIQAERTLKIGGILVSCNSYSNEFVVVFGSGTNIDNEKPTTCINKRIRDLNAGPTILTESLLARYMVKVEEYFENFLVNGFKPFEQMYYNVWLHSNAKVSLERYGHVQATITGISSETGMLIAEDENRIKYELQPDGNSFDMFNGLIRKKIY